MYLYYLLGNASGDIMRAYACLKALNIDENDAIILCNNIHILPQLQNIKRINVPEQFMYSANKLRQFQEDLILHYKITNILLDSYPYGMLGEWQTINPKTPPLHYVARIIKWENYATKILEPQAQLINTYILEYLPDEQINFILQKSKYIKFIKLNYFDLPINYQNINIPSDKNVWIIINTGDAKELEMLFYYAQQAAAEEGTNPTWYIVSQVPINNLEYNTTILHYPLSFNTLDSANKIITNAGFNHSYLPHKLAHKHIIIPFYRDEDDEFLRIRMKRTPEVP